MKHLKRILCVFLILGIFIGSFLGSLRLFKQGTYHFDTEKIAVFDEDISQYYLQKVEKDIIFRVRCDEGQALGYSLLDANNEQLQVKANKVYKNYYDILPPAGGYTEGSRYTLSLAEGVFFESEDLREARTLVFSVDKAPIELYTFTDAVVEVNTVIEEPIDNKLDSTPLNIHTGDILFGRTKDGEFVAYKVMEIDEDGTATVTVPALDEIYSDLEVYGEYVWDVQEIAANPDLEIEIIENIRQSSFFHSLMMTAYAADTPRDGKIKVKIKPDLPNNSLGLEVEITLEPGEKGLFGMGELRNQTVSLTASTDIALSTKCDIQGVFDWDLSASVATGFSWKVDLSLYTDDWKKDGDLASLFSEKNRFANRIDYHKNVRKITEKLNNLTADINGGEIKLFEGKIHVPSVPGLYFGVEVKLFAQFDIAADVTVANSMEAVYTIGVCFTGGNFRPYSNMHVSNRDCTLSLSGKAKAKTGIKLLIKAALINDEIARISLDPRVGLYADLFVTSPISGQKDIDGNSFLYSYFEPGAFLDASINAGVNLLVKKFEFSYGTPAWKFPIKEWTFGNKKIAMGLMATATTVRAMNRTVLLPDILFEYYDVTAGSISTEKLSPDDVKFASNDGTRLYARDGKIDLGEAVTSGDVYITATYLHTDGKAYSTTFRVLISGSILEGKVSAYGTGASMQELAGAAVKLYAGTDRTTPISTLETDESGRFSFHVAKGNYTLVISADGYRSLTSGQSVSEDEIKYTEHILLMDSHQSGSGSVGGTVLNALDGSGLSDVAIKLRPDWNNTDGVYYDYETLTNSVGRYSIENIPVGYYTVEASRHGYVTGYTNILVLSEETREDFDFTITPILNPDETRIVLTWGSAPADLDSHLLGRTPSGGMFNVYYKAKEYYYEGVEMANLDVDDVTGYGPETVTIVENIYGTYTYIVHNFSNKGASNSTALSFSGAVVRVFVGSMQAAQYHVPTDQIGTYWTVFEMDENRRITPINTISNNKTVP